MASDDLVARLRRIDTHDVATRNEAADHIEELTAVVRLLETERDMWKDRANGLLAELARVLHDTGLAHIKEAEADG